MENIKVVINRKFGGFGLSDEARALFEQTKGKSIWDYEHKRSDPILIQVVEQLGAKANGEYADLIIVEIPGDVKWHIEEYDGFETIHENHRVWP